MHLSFFQFLREQFKRTPPLVNADLTGKTVVVTGANIGLGYEAAKHFARMNPGRLILACRSQKFGEIALAKIKEETGCKSIELWLIDLSSFASVISFYERFEADGGRLDILVENAAVLPVPKSDEYTADGWFPGVQINNLSTSLFALLLLPRMVQTAKEHHTVPRLVVVASEVHYWTKIDKAVIDSPTPWQTYNKPENYRHGPPITRYYDSKLLNVLFVRALAERLPSSKPVIVNSVNPGYCVSQLRRSLTLLERFGDWIFERLVARTTEEGSRQLVWAALGHASQEKDLKGAYLSLSQIYEPSDYVISEEGKRAQDRLWDDLVVELGKVEPRVIQVVKDLFHE